MGLVLVLVLVGCGGGGGDRDSADVGPPNGDPSRDDPSTTTTEAPVLSPPESSTFEVDGLKVSMPCEGAGDVPVVLLAGATDPAAVWDDLVAAIGPDELVCRFDAPGVGASDPPEEPVTASTRADALDATLAVAGLDAPVVLVAHSLGGQTARQFGARHPERLAGAVLLDPTTRLAMLTLHDELAADGWDVTAADAEAEATVGWPEVPLVVLSHDPARGDLGPPEVEQIWSDGQAEYAALSPGSRLEAVTGSGHYVYLDATETVAAAIDEVLTGVRRDR